MPSPKTDNIKKIIRVSTVISVLIMIVAIGWTAFFMLQILEIIPSLHSVVASDTGANEIESVNSSLLERVIEQLRQKTERPEPLVGDLKNPFVIPTEAAQPEPVPPAAPETPPVAEPAG